MGDEINNATMPAWFYVNCIPRFVRSIVIYYVPEDVIEELSRRNIVVINGSEEPERGDLDHQSPDAAFFFLEKQDITGPERHWKTLLDKLSEETYVFVASKEAYHLSMGFSQEELTQSLKGLPWRHALSWTITNYNGATILAPVFMLTHIHYKPLNRARKLLQQKRPGDAYEVLSLIPEEHFATPREKTLVDAEMQLCLLKIEEVLPKSYQLSLFFTSLNLFYHAVAIEPLSPEPYYRQAEFWSRIGLPQMGTRLLRSLNFAKGSPLPKPIQQDTFTQPISHSTKGISEIVKEKPLRVLFILPKQPHYGLDVLYDGLCEILGEDNVVDFPYKPTLHGESPLEALSYPCVFNRRGTQISMETIDALIQAHHFDLILYGDVRGALDSTEVAKLVQKTSVPIFLVDQEDTPVDSLPEREQRLQVKFIAQFKREKLLNYEYSANTYALPFSYPLSLLSPFQNKPRQQKIFWAGHRMFGLRRLYLENIEKYFGLSLDKTYTQQEYVNQLKESEIALSFFGFGFDTVRYWEAPAHGCMLLAERVPIEIPYNFEDGISAVFFDDLGDLLEKLSYYVSHPEETRKIAMQGHEHFLKYHTNKARAVQLLTTIIKVLTSS